jgi:hypothetical protein
MERGKEGRRLSAPRSQLVPELNARRVDLGRHRRPRLLEEIEEEGRQRLLEQAVVVYGATNHTFEAYYSEISPSDLVDSRAMGCKIRPIRGSAFGGSAGFETQGILRK